MHTGLTADCTHLDIDMDGYLNYLKEGSTIDVDSVKWNMEDINLKMTRPAFGGHLMATIICPRFPSLHVHGAPWCYEEGSFRSG